jgi:hypothetical protein
MLPFVFLAAEEGGLALLASELDAIEFCRARDVVGRGTGAGAGVGTGDGRLAGVFVSGKVPITGDDAAERAFLRVEGSQHRSLNQSDWMKPEG